MAKLKFQLQSIHFLISNNKKIIIIIDFWTKVYVHAHVYYLYNLLFFFFFFLLITQIFLENKNDLPWSEDPWTSLACHPWQKLKGNIITKMTVL